MAGALGYFITLCAFFHLPMLVLGFDVDGEADVFINGGWCSARNGTELTRHSIERSVIKADIPMHPF